MNRNSLFTALAILLLIFVACTINPLSDGTGEETTNGMVVGILQTQNNEPAGNTRVLLIPGAYNPLINGATIQADTTDSSGSYVFFHVKPGSYNIQALHYTFRTGALKTGIRVYKDTVSVPADTLCVSGSVSIALSPELKIPNSYVYIPGTTFYSMVAVTDSVVVLDSVPAGTLLSINHGITTSPIQTVIRYRVPVVSGDTVAVNMSSWQYTQRLVLNTSASGAAVASNQYRFPVLIRLSSSNFNFGEAKSDGGDIRFASRNNTPLSYEIEQWDAYVEKAAIWVKVDTVFGGSATQFISMYWGNSAVADSSSGVTVFDTASGFSGVWHLNETPIASTGSMKDRTANRYDGTPSGSMNSGSCVDGIIGRAVRFNGTSDWIRIQRPVQDDFTIAFWMLAASNSLQDPEPEWWNGNGLVDGDNLSGTMNDFGVAYLNNTISTGVGFDGHDSTLMGTKPVNDTLWHFIAVTRSRSSGARAIFIDGQSAGNDVSVTNSLTGTDSLSFGALGTTHRPYSGMLDEIVITDNVRSADWIKLSFMNQKAKDVLVEFK